MGALNRHNKTAYRESPTLFLEFHGTAAAVVEQAKAVQEIAREHGGLDFQWATRQEERTKLWEARHNAYFACLQLKPGSRALSTDVCVPISRLAECISETAQDIEAASLPIPLFGHVGDGNFHLVILIDPKKAAEIEEAKAINVRVVERALAMEGTCTGEHGVGIGKQQYLRQELGDDVIGMMRDIKQLIDPENLMNPGKVVTIQ
jgi:D-lactate dehydrogenase (cytochrome)